MFSSLFGMNWNSPYSIPFLLLLLMLLLVGNDVYVDDDTSVAELKSISNIVRFSVLTNKFDGLISRCTIWYGFEWMVETIRNNCVKTLSTFFQQIVVLRRMMMWMMLVVAESSRRCRYCYLVHRWIVQMLVNCVSDCSVQVSHND
jgi:hypothetical protein